MTPDQRRRHKLWGLSLWQWAVLGSYLVAIVLTIRVGILANRAGANADRGNAAICVEVAFLNNSLRATERAIRVDPAAPENPARRVSAAKLRDLVARLEAEVPNCRTALQ